MPSKLAMLIHFAFSVHLLYGAPIKFAFYPGDSTCTAVRHKVIDLQSSQDANRCNGGWTPPTGNDNSYRIHSCSSKCICFTQFTGSAGFGYNCASTGDGYIGSNIKESCSDRCSGDCDGPNCQFTAPQGHYNRTWIKLAAPPSCDNQLPDEEYECNTTGMSPYSSKHQGGSAAQLTTTAGTTPPGNDSRQNSQHQGGSAAQATTTAEKTLAESGDTDRSASRVHAAAIVFIMFSCSLSYHCRIL